MAISSKGRNYWSRGGNPIGILPAASTFYVHGLGNDIKVGWGCFHRGR
ncbi:MAG TPA: hypothetical protein VFH05_02610 [Nitrospira sp.]|nr:hypothetical protein [Nitrospira sp.]